MTGGRVTSTGLTMPPDFPAEPYEVILDTVRRHHETMPDAWREFVFGWNALSYRYAAVADHDEAFSRSIQANGLSPQPPGRYRQEDELFGFFVSGLSALETFAYGTWAVAWAAGDADFALSTDEQRAGVGIKALRKRFKEPGYAAESLARALGALIDPRGSQFNAWAKVRNELTHRGVHGRHHLSVPQTMTAWGTMSLDEHTTTQHRAWLATTLAELLAAAERFTLARL